MSKSALAPKYVIFLAVLPVVLFLDLWTKWYIVDHFRVGESSVVVSEFFSITYARNYGAAFSMFRDLSAGTRNIFFGCVTLSAIGLIGWFLHKIQPKDYWLALGLSLILAGALGNAANRYEYGYVVDFLDFYWGKGGPTWPTFNVADIGISVGASLIFLTELLRKEDPALAADVPAAAPVQGEG